MNQVNHKKVCEPANSQLYKTSDAKDLSADAKIIIALLRQQPLKRIELCEKANINESTFSRYKRLLLNKGILRELDQGFSLWFQNEPSKLWETLFAELQKVGGHFTTVKLERLLIDRINPPDIGCARYRKYGNPVSIEGIIILKGSVKLEQALGLGLPCEYKFYAGNRPSGGFFVTPVSIKKGDGFAWADKKFEVDYTEQFFDGDILSFTLAMLKQPT